jgi:hypothetical protein
LPFFPPKRICCPKRKTHRQLSLAGGGLMYAELKSK